MIDLRPRAVAVPRGRRTSRRTAVTASRSRWSLPATIIVVVLVIAGCGSPASEEVAPGAASTTAVPVAAPSTTATAMHTATRAATPTAAADRQPSSAGPPPPGPEPAVPARLRGQDVTELPTGQKVVALTFDAGAGAQGLSRILRALADHHVPATFFLTGRWAQANPSGVAQIVAAGHRVGNHSMTHPAFTGLSDGAVTDEVRAAERAIRAAGADPRPLFRFPLGDRDERTILTVNQAGYVPVRWTVDTLGWKGTSGGMSPQRVADRALAALRPGQIVLMHIGANPDDSSTLDADALPDMIARMRGAGYAFVTLEALLSG
jgi:peptidoglycan/xylan/chitin deacetylase (PgdA/CDA1 family)